MANQKNEPEVITEMLQDYLHPAEGFDKLQHRVERLRKMRNAIVHPKPPRLVGELDVMDKYVELRQTVDSLFWELAWRILGCRMFDLRLPTESFLG